MLFTRRRLVFGITALLSRRFVPPWERDGKTADDFFAGLMQSSNPIISERRKRKRQEEEEDRNALAEELSLHEKHRIDEVHLHNESLLNKQREFVPYGAAPVIYFDHNQMAAVGDYEAMLQTASHQSVSGCYSPSVMNMLRDDLHQKLPYRYEAFVPPRNGQSQWPLHGTAGVVLDVDGVVYRSKKLIEGSDTAIRRLMELRIPLLFMTNGGGVSEAAKAREYSELLGTVIEESQILLSHTPMQLLAPMYKNQNVLIVGLPESVDVARAYGFDRATSMHRFQVEHPELVPYRDWGKLKKCEVGSVPYPEIAAIFQFCEPSDVLSDIQAIIDVLLAPRGQVGRYVSSTQCVPYYLASDDLLWATEAPLPRLGQGAVREMLSAAFKSVSGQRLNATIYGKPRAIAYAFAEKRMKEVCMRLGWDPSNMRAIFMVGDNIETDIMGANARGGRWVSVHVLSGVRGAPAAFRALSDGDTEFEWLEKHGDRTPHYVSPTLDHFVRELLAFPELAMLQNKKPYYGMPNPVNLSEMYGFGPESD
ncbi:putative Haloacid dehalogenase like hydrolase HAD hyrolase like [Trypanosoma vivax]|uniref:Uncharacterized protein n=1 Tax=Trypanosoma vivax (strain Y486) TaxID=1055687 RepID=G0U2Z6_TRYVY|nr:hypothetical protein TRVL_02696 [Trypanosoma vivax]KAH8604200.1 putative Haloacid dehalogenase like hydrolase HAD hyrolase like [Trypanosoma vivax]CCC50651.1 conserved hypothetical protein [Trypanosoma vivax Y486]